MDIVLRTALFYFVVLFTLRMTTRRIMRTSTPLDMVVIFLVGGMAVQAALAGDQSITGVSIGIGTVAAVHMLVSSLKMRLPLVGRIVEGSPVVLFSQGRWARDEMMRSRVQEQDVFAEMRSNGMASMDEVDTAVIEHNGGLSFLPKEK